jgi:hypothetical protein
MRWPQFKEGAYAIVFFSDDRATKVFRKRCDAPESHVESVFLSEVCAYELAYASAELRSLIPTFYGRVTVQKVTDEFGVDISNQFYLHRAYQMQRIEGEFVKLGTLTANVQRPISDSFRSAGISHTCDASVIVKDGAVSSIIDFATQEFVLEHQPL